MAPRNESGAAAEAPEAATAKPDAAEDRAADAPALFSQRGGAQAKLHVLLVEDDQATMVQCPEVVPPPEDTDGREVARTNISSHELLQCIF